ncbi:MAG TPA: tetratricopeptide repeat protein [Solimonas sp.]|nr:tetratricopeptide repeat protein [Solimonas sp.]
MKPCYVSLAPVFMSALLLAACAAPSPRPPAPPASITPSRLQAPASLPRGADADQRFKTALALLKNGQPQPARDILLALAREQPELSAPLTALGMLYAQGRQRDQAIATFSKAVAANPANAIALNWLGSLQREAGNYAAAEQSYRRAIAVRADYAAPHLNLGILYDVSLQRPQQALASYRSYLQVSGSENLIVSAWIRELESAQPAPISIAGAAP